MTTIRILNSSTYLATTLSNGLFIIKPTSLSKLLTRLCFTNDNRTNQINFQTDSDNNIVVVKAKNKLIQIYEINSKIEHILDYFVQSPIRNIFRFNKHKFLIICEKNIYVLSYNDENFGEREILLKDSKAFKVIFVFKC